MPTSSAVLSSMESQSGMSWKCDIRNLKFVPTVYIQNSWQLLTWSGWILPWLHQYGTVLCPTCIVRLTESPQCMWSWTLHLPRLLLFKQVADVSVGCLANQDIATWLPLDVRWPKLVRPSARKLWGHLRTQQCLPLFC
jgi:hypothetical protein